MTSATANNWKSSKQVETLHTRSIAIAAGQAGRIDLTEPRAKLQARASRTGLNWWRQLSRHLSHCLSRSLSALPACAMLVATCSSLIAAGPAAALDKTAINPPPSAQLEYAIRADVMGLVLEGTSQINWITNSTKYSLQLETRTALTGVLLTDKSEGGYDRYGLAPDSYSMRRFRKDAAVANFDRKAGQINFAGNGAPYKLQGGEQDRVSVLWELLSTARARPALVAGSSWTYYVAGHRGGEPWTFQLKDKQKVQTGVGEVEAWHFAHVPADKKTTTQVDIWLAPSKEWFPVKIRFSEPNGDYIEQSLDKITRK